MESLLCRLVVAVIPLVTLFVTIAIIETLHRRRQLRIIRSQRRAHAVAIGRD